MAGRSRKVGLDYFEMDCHTDEKIRLIQAEFGLKGFAIVVKLFQKIYGECGYYCEWNEDSSLLFMSENGVSSREEKNLIHEIVAACIRRDIFSDRLYKKYGVLTSVRVQETYLNATARRESVSVKKEYLLVGVDKNSKNVDINSISVDINSISVDRNAQSREEKSREEYKYSLCNADASALFERLWKLYPLKRGKESVTAAQKKKLLSIGEDEMLRALGRYKDDLAKDDWRRPMNGGRFFKSGYVDYLDANYEAPAPNKKAAVKTKFSNFSERSNDYDALQQALLQKSMS